MKNKQFTYKELKELHIKLHDGFEHITECWMDSELLLDIDLEQIKVKGIETLEDLYKYQEDVLKDIEELAYYHKINPMILLKQLIFELSL